MTASNFYKLSSFPLLLVISCFSSIFLSDIFCFISASFSLTVTRPLEPSANIRSLSCSAIRSDIRKLATGFNVFSATACISSAHSGSLSCACVLCSHISSSGSSSPISSALSPFSSMLRSAFNSARRSSFSASSCSCAKCFVTSTFAVSS